MKLSAPTELVFLLSVLLIVLAVAATFVAVPFVSSLSFEIAIFAYLVLMAGNLLEGISARDCSPLWYGLVNSPGNDKTASDRQIIIVMAS